MGRLAQRRREEFAALVEEPVACGAVSAIAVVVGDGDRIQLQATGGRRERNGSVPSTASLFDLASLTKPVTASLALVLDAAGLLPLDAKVGEVWQGCEPRLARRLLSDLLRHRSGLMAWTPLYNRFDTRRDLERAFLSGSLLGARKSTYSDLGYIFWAMTASRALGRDAGSLLRSHLLRPLGLVRQMTDRPGASSRTVRCSLDMNREVELAAEQGVTVELSPPLRGQAQDGNARWLGGYCGHAGLFGSSIGLWRLGAEWLRPRLLDSAAVEGAVGGRTRFAVGWWRRTVSGSGGRGLDQSSFGHTGFTGGSLWIDPRAGRVCAVLAHRTKSDVQLNPWRRRLHTWCACG